MMRKYCICIKCVVDMQNFFCSWILRRRWVCRSCVCRCGLCRLTFAGFVDLMLTSKYCIHAGIKGIIASEAKRSEAKRSELARELPVAVKGCTIVGKKTSHNSKTKRFWTMVHRRKNVCFHPLNRSPKVAARPGPNAFSETVSLKLSCIGKNVISNKSW